MFCLTVVDHTAKASFLLFKENYGDFSREDVCSPPSKAASLAILGQ